MNSSIAFSICSLFYVILIMIMYFSKERLKNDENKIYSILVITTFIGLSVEVISTALSLMTTGLVFVKMIFYRLIMLYFVSWIFVFFTYIYYISKKHRRISIRGLLVLYLVIAFVTLVLPLYIKSSNNIVQYTYGPSVNFAYLVSGVFIVICIGLMIYNYKHIKSKKYIPLFAFMGIGVLVALVQAICPNLLLMSSMEAFVTMLMYFTIENPDVQIMEELYKNKKLIEKSNEDTSNFLFRMIQDIKKPIKNMTDISDNLKFSDNINELKDGMKFINNNSRDLDYLINDVLDVSAMNTRRLKIYDSRYNPVNLFKEVEYRFRESIDKNVKFHFSISNNMPEYLYGDSIKLKQSISSILKKALDKTEKGSIELDVSDIIKYGICRLIITITDTGCGISIDEVNKILSLNSEDLAAIDLRDRDGEYLNLREVKKMISLLGGNLMVKSETGKGTVVTIILEQKIVETRQTTISKKLEAYEQSLYHNKKIMVVDDDAKELAMITTWLENHDAVVNGSLFGRDCIEKIASNMKYDLILLDDDTSTYSALEVLKELKEKTNFKIPVVVMIDDGKEFIKLHYLQDGFADCILKSKLESELERILKRF